MSKDHSSAIAIDYAGLPDFFIKEAVFGGSFTTASAILAQYPELARDNIHAACAAGDAEAVEALLASNPALATLKGGPKNWEPLLYLCYSLALHRDPPRTPAMMSIARQLLSVGADPNSFFLGEPPRNTRHTALCGASGIANHPALTRLLLNAGACPNDSAPENEGTETMYRTAEFRDLTCLRLLMERGVAEPAKAYGLKRKLDYEDVAGVRFFLENGADPNVKHPNVVFGGSALHHAIDRWRSLEIIRLLVDFGADVNQACDQGVTPYSLAMRLGRLKTAKFLEENGADTALTLADLLFTACAKSDSGMVKASQRIHPAIIEDLSIEDRKSLAKAAKENRLEAAQMMLDAGFDIDEPESGLTPLHWAVWFGHAEMTALLLTYYPPLEVTGGFGHTPLETAILASRYCHSHSSGSGNIGPDTERGLDYLRIVDMLITAGSPLSESLVGLGAPVVDKLVMEAMTRNEFAARR